MPNRREQGTRRRALRRQAKPKAHAQGLQRGLAQQQTNELRIGATGPYPPDVQDGLNEVADRESAAVRTVLQKGRTEFNVTDLTIKTLAWADEMLRSVHQQFVAGGPPLHCREGCSWCCYMHVSCSVPEVLLIAKRLRETLNTEQLTAIRERVAQAYSRTRGLNSQQRARTPVACPLLIGNRCGVYEVRPLACRGWNSYQVAACQRSVEQADPDVPIPQNVYLRALTDGIGVGLQEGVAKEGLKPVLPIELIAGLHIALETAHATERWLAGEPIFTPAAVQP